MVDLPKSAEFPLLDPIGHLSILLTLTVKKKKFRVFFSNILVSYLADHYPWTLSWNINTYLHWDISSVTTLTTFFISPVDLQSMFQPTLCQVKLRVKRPTDWKTIHHVLDQKVAWLSNQYTQRAWKFCRTKASWMAEISAMKPTGEKRHETKHMM